MKNYQIDWQKAFKTMPSEIMAEVKKAMSLEELNNQLLLAEKLPQK